MNSILVQKYMLAAIHGLNVPLSTSVKWADYNTAIQDIAAICETIVKSMSSQNRGPGLEEGFTCLWKGRSCEGGYLRCRCI